MGTNLVCQKIQKWQEIIINIKMYIKSSWNTLATYVEYVKRNRRLTDLSVFSIYMYMARLLQWVKQRGPMK